MQGLRQAISRTHQNGTIFQKNVKRSRQRNTGAEQHGQVQLRASRSAIDILRTSGVQQGVNIKPDTTRVEIVAHAAIQNIIAVTTIKIIIARFAEEPIIAFVTIEKIVSEAAVNFVFSNITPDRVRSTAAGQYIIAPAAGDLVVPFTALDFGNDAGIIH